MTMLTKITNFAKINLTECFRFPNTYKGFGAEKKTNKNGEYIYYMKTGCSSAISLNGDYIDSIPYISMYTEVIPVNVNFTVNE